MAFARGIFRISAENLPESVYLFIDNEDNKLYYVSENSVIITNINNFIQHNSEEVYTYDAEVIIGNYNKPYVEKYVQKGQTTFLSLGIFTKTYYKFYIPQDSGNQ